MADGVSGVTGVFVLNQWMAYKPGAGTVSAINQDVVVIPAKEPEFLWSSVETHKAAQKVSLRIPMLKAPVVINKFSQA